LVILYHLKQFQTVVDTCGKYSRGGLATLHKRRFDQPFRQTIANNSENLSPKYLCHFPGGISYPLELLQLNISFTECAHALGQICPRVMDPLKDCSQWVLDSPLDQLQKMRYINIQTGTFLLSLGRIKNELEVPSLGL
jgi:hypothetical protein